MRLIPCAAARADRGNRQKSKGRDFTSFFDCEAMRSGDGTPLPLISSHFRDFT
jgi:hypothetical protein